MRSGFPGVGGGAAGQTAARRPNSNRCAKGRGTAGGAFTLIELLVVIGIIVVLIGILLPALGGAKNRARLTTTQSLMANLQSDIEAYNTRFGAYPGPVSAQFTTNNSVTGSQNLLLGISYAVAFPPLVGTGPGLPGPNGGTVYSLTATGPIDNATVKPDGSHEQLPPYFTPTPKQIAIFNGMGIPNLPVPVDAFPDGLPILYYRRTPGVETPAVGTNTGSLAGYYFNENSVYTGSTNLVSSSGVSFNETLGGFNSAGLSALVTNTDAAGVAHAHGGYVLISAGLDRYFGTYNNKTDDVVIVGGD